MTAAASLLAVPHVTAVLYLFVWPSASAWSGPARAGNPELGNRMYLLAQTGHCLVILRSGEVRGRSEQDEFGLLEITTVDFNQEVRLRGVAANLYLAMDSAGDLYGEADPKSAHTVFVSGVHGLYNTYQAGAHRGEPGWFVGLRRRSGLPRPGPLTRRDQRAAQFLPVRPEPTS